MHRLLIPLLAFVSLPLASGAVGGPPVFHQRLDSLPFLTAITVLVALTIVIEIAYHKLKRFAACEDNNFIGMIVTKASRVECAHAAASNTSQVRLASPPPR